MTYCVKGQTWGEQSKDALACVSKGFARTQSQPSTHRPSPYEKYYVIVQIQNHTSTHRPSLYYTFGDNKFEQQSKAYWDKIKGKK